MFGNSKSARIKAADEALAAGRIDEAWSLVSDPGLTGQPRVGELLARLCAPLLRRAQEHAVSERFVEALADLDRAARCGVDRDKVEEWRNRIVDAMNDRQRQLRERRDQVEAARQRLASGELTVARGLLDAAADHPDADALAAHADRQQQRAAALLAEATEALAGGDLDRAAQRAAAARALHPGADPLVPLEREIAARALADAREAWQAGRLDRLPALRAALTLIESARAPRDELETWLNLAARAAQAVAAADFRQAEVLLGQLSQLAPQSRWVGETAALVRELADRRARLDAGPLGLLAARPESLRAAAPAGETLYARRTPAIAPPPVVADVPLPPRYLLRIDGVGSFLVLRSDRITIGRAGGGSLADLPLVSDLPDHAAELTRRGDDYFLRSAVDAAVGGRPIREALLTSGDRIDLGRRVRMTFLQPSRKSATAILDLATGLRSVGDVRRVLLADGPILVGSTTECHVPVRGVQLVLVERGGRLAVREFSPAAGAAQPLAFGQVLDIGGVRMSVQPVAAAASGGMVAGEW